MNASQYKTNRLAAITNVGEYSVMVDFLSDDSDASVAWEAHPDESQIRLIGK